MTNVRATVLSAGKMEESMKDSGRTESSMELVFSRVKTTHKLRGENGSMERRFNGWSDLL